MCKIIYKPTFKVIRCGKAFVCRISKEEQAILAATFGPEIDKSEPWSHADLVHKAIERACEAELVGA